MNNASVSCLLSPVSSARPSGRAAFTLVELLVVISIIVLLLGLLLPAVLWAQRQAYISATLADMHALSVGLDQYHADFHIYPNSSIVDGTSGAYGGAIPQGAGFEVMAEALLGFLPGSPVGTGDGAGAASSATVTLTQTQGFAMAPYKKVYGPYMSTTATNIYMVAGTSPTNPPEYYFIDSFAQAGQAAGSNAALMPILYYSANTNPAGTTSGSITYIFGDSVSGSPQNQGIFNIADNSPASGSTLPGATAAPTPTPTNNTVADFYNLIGDPKQDNQVDSGANIMGSDGYLLVSAGPDGSYFTADDIVYGQ